MKVVGIIAEYNPFHLGHAYQLGYVKEVLKADAVVVAMSGDFVQRGTPALLEKHVRAKMALLGGADLVLELPVQWASASAERFALGGTALLDSLGIVDELCFGCESGATADFTAAAKLLCEEPEEYRRLLQAYLTQGKSFPAARAAAFHAYRALPSAREDASCTDKSVHAADDLLSSPNNILGIEYCKALLRLSSHIRPQAIKRRGASYHDTSLSENLLPSASGIRKAVSEYLRTSGTSPDSGSFCSPDSGSFCSPPAFESRMPKSAYCLLMDALSRQETVTEDSMDLLLFYALQQAIYSNTLTQVQDMTPALSRRITHTIRQYRSFSQYTQLLKTREITHTHLRRALLHVFLGLRGSDTLPSYVRILGFRRQSAWLLKELQTHAKLPLIMKAASAKQQLSEAARKSFQENMYCSGLYDMLIMANQAAQQKAPKAIPHEYQKPMVIVP